MLISPTPDQIYAGIKAIATDKGVLMVIKNYTGDVMNFEMAGFSITLLRLDEELKGLLDAKADTPAFKQE